jgi:hypothetical protein
MRVKNRWLASAASLFLAVGVTGVTGEPASASSPPINGTGAVNGCGYNHAVVAKMKFNPPLVNGGTATSETISLTAKGSGPCLGGLTSGDGVNVVGFKLVGTQTETTNNCSTLLPSTSTYSTVTETVTIKWKTAPHTPRLNPSTAIVRLGSTTIGSAGRIGSVTSGSFSGKTFDFAMGFDQTAAALGAECGAAGVKKITAHSVSPPGVSTGYFVFDCM